MTVEPASDDLIAELEDILGGIPNWTMAALIARIRQAEAEIGLLREALETSVQNHTAAQKVAVSLIAERDAALARVMVMDEALAPLGVKASEWDEEVCGSKYPDEALMVVTLGQLRAARAARKEPT